MTSIKNTGNGYVIRDTVPAQGSNVPFPILAVLFPRLHNILMIIFGRFGFGGVQQPSRTRITEIRRTDEGWQILEYG